MRIDLCSLTRRAFAWTNNIDIELKFELQILSFLLCYDYTYSIDTTAYQFVVWIVEFLCLASIEVQQRVAF